MLLRFFGFTHSRFTNQRQRKEYEARLASDGYCTSKLDRLKILRLFPLFIYFFLILFLVSPTGHSRVRNASSVSSVKIWQEYASKNIANVCRVSFVFKINFVDSRTQIRSAVRTFGETALRNFLRVLQLNRKIAIHACRSCCCCSFYRGLFPASGKSYTIIPRLVMNCSSLYICEKSRTNRLLHWTIPWSDSKTAPLSRSGATSTGPKITRLFFVCLFVCLHHRAHRHCSHGVFRRNLAKVASGDRQLTAVRDTSVASWYCRYSVFNLGLKSKNADAVRRRHEVNWFNTLTLWFVCQSVLS